MMKRRTFLALGAAAGGTAALGAVLVGNGYRSWVLGVLRQALPGYVYDPAGLDLFIEESQSRYASAMKFRLFGAAESVVDARSLLPQRMTRRVENAERDLLTDFLVGSDFFQLYPHGARTITYSGRPAACASPFVVFDL